MTSGSRPSNVAAARSIRAERGTPLSAVVRSRSVSSVITRGPFRSVPTPHHRRPPPEHLAESWETFLGVLLASRVLPALRSRRSEEHTSELQSRGHLVCRLLLEKKNKKVETQLL